MDILNEEFGPAGPVGLLPETNPLFCAVLENNLNKLKSSVECGQSVNSKNYRGSLLLNVVIEHRRTEIFDYLLSLTQLDINAVDNFGRSALLYAASEAPDDYFARQLIKKGADVNIADKSGATFLIRAASRMEVVNLNVGQLVIEKGACVDAKSANGVTALFAACEMGNYDWICMLLYYGADPTIVPDDAVLPVVKLSHDLPNDQLNHLQEVLYNYTFDAKTNVQLRTLVAAMLYDTPIFPKILEITQDVSYDLSDLELFHAELINVNPKHLSLFLGKFGNIAMRMIENFPPLNILRRVRCPVFVDFNLGYPNDDIVRMKENIDVFLESQLVAEFVQTADHSFPTILRLIDVFRRNRIFVKNEEEEEITKRVCVMLSYGLTVTAADAHAVYTYYGYCELFKILLHMDIDISHPVTRGCVIPRLCYDPCKDIEDFTDIFPSGRLLDYYSLPKVKELCLAATTNKEIVSKIRSLPPVPLLVELSRNAARKYIVKRYNVQNSNQFYTVLKGLPVGEMNKSIISLEKKLYSN